MQIIWKQSSCVALYCIHFSLIIIFRRKLKHQSWEKGTKEAMNLVEKLLKMNVYTNVFGNYSSLTSVIWGGTFFFKIIEEKGEEDICQQNNLCFEEIFLPTPVWDSACHDIFTCKKQNQTDYKYKGRCYQLTKEGTKRKRNLQIYQWIIEVKSEEKRMAIHRPNYQYKGVDNRNCA